MTKDEIIALGVDEAVAEQIVNDNESMREEYEERLLRLERNYDIEKLVMESGAKNIKAVRALIDEDADVGEQLNNLKRNEATAFLFEKMKKSFSPSKSAGSAPDMTRSGYEQRLKKARSERNTLEAIRIKQQAASEGIMLL